MKVLVTGGAGFIGSHLVDKLVELDHEVVVIDNLDPQVHGNQKPEYLNPKARYVFENIRNKEILKTILNDVEIVYHQAATVGIGQSMYEIKHYVDVNLGGTAALLDVLVNKENNVKKIMLAASMSSYGEGDYSCDSCGNVSPPLRTQEQMSKNMWELECPKCNKIVKPLPTSENKNLDVNSIYAITKKVQEEMLMNIGKTYGIPCVSLRYFNVYGPRQSLNNPYTGVAAIFSSRIKNNNSPLIFEDGLQTRDFISVHDIVQANLLALEKTTANYEIFNVGSGSFTTIKNVADILIKLYNSSLQPKITNQFRKGDVRHCVADISKIKNKLGFEPSVKFEDGMKELVEWGEKMEAVDKSDDAYNELKEKGLV